MQAQYYIDWHGTDTANSSASVAHRYAPAGCSGSSHVFHAKIGSAPAGNATMNQRDNHRTPRQFWISSFLVPACLLASPVQSIGKLTPHTAEYKVRFSVASGRLNTELEATEFGYVARHTIVPTGLSRLVRRGSIAEVAEFATNAHGVSPIAYRSRDSLSSDKVRADIRFDWDANEASGTINDEDLVSALQGLSYDRVSIQYALMHDLLDDGPNTQYRMFDVDKLKTVNVRSIGHKQIKVPAGTFNAIGIQHQAENSSRVMTLWCAEELDYLPIIIEQHRKGKLRVRATLRSYKPTD
jgi:hypothetical protein